MSERRLMLLDSASLYFRAFHGVPDRRSDPSRPPSNAVRGFADMVATLLQRWPATDVVACWDDDWRPAFRVAAVGSYKAHRVAADGAAEEVPRELQVQVPVIERLLAAVGIARVGVAGYEADDVIGTLAVRARGVAAVDVVTGDRDLFQLVDDEQRVRVLYTARGGVREPDVVDQAWLAQRYQVASGSAYADMAVLRGDASDGLPGVAGIGEKTAAALIGRYGDLDALLAALDGDDPALSGARRARLEAAREYLRVAPRVVRVALDVPVPDGLDTAVPAVPADPAALERLAAEHDVRSPVERLVAALGRRGASA